MATIAIGAEQAARTRPTSGLLSWLTTIDHKRIGLLYGFSAFAFLLIAGVEALLIRAQLARPNSDIVGSQTYNELFTMHGTTMIFFAVMPIGFAFFGNYLMPLQIGARDVAFPRLNAFSFWMFFAGGVMLHLSWFFSSAPNGGWYAYAPLTDIDWNPGRNIDFFLFALLISGVGTIGAGINLIITIVNMRAPGMTMMRVPIFTWSILITSILIILAFQPLTVGLIFLMLDRYAGTGFFLNAAGGDPLLWQHLFWVFGHPEVYIMVLPAFGIISEVVPVFSRKTLFGYAVMVYALGAIAFLGFGVWAHHMFTTGMGATANTVFSASSFMIAIPTGVKVFNWIGTLFRGSLQFTVSMLFATAFIAQFVVGGISGIMHATPVVDQHQNDTYFDVAHFHYVLFGGSLFAIMAGIYYWFPKMAGRMLDERIGRWQFWLMFAGFNITFFPMHFLGLAGMPRRYYTYGAESGWTFWNAVVSLGSLILASGFIVFLYNISYSLRNGRTAPSDPWDGATLEWTTTSPPPAYNFEHMPVVTHRDQLWAEKYGVKQGNEGEIDVTLAGNRIGEVEVQTDAFDAHAEERRHERYDTNPGSQQIHMPNPSIYPFLAAVGFFVAGLGMLLESGPRLTIGLLHLPWLTVIGLAFVVYMIYAWAFEPAS